MISEPLRICIPLSTRRCYEGFAFQRRHNLMTSSEKRIELRPFVPRQRLKRPDGFTTASVSVGLNGDVIRLLVEQKSLDALVARMEQPGWASFPRTHTDTGYSSIVVVSGPSGSRETHLSGMTATFPKVEILPDGKILVVAPRCYRNQDGTHELNARIYNSDGVEQQKFLLGDGISHVQADVNGNIWVGYFDEGVYGNFGWQYPVGPFGAAGLSCFDPSGKKIWDFEPPNGFDHISDCNALNVAKTGVWAYYYTDFPIALVDSDFRVRCWSSESAGGGAFAVASERVLLYGGYGDRRTACSLLQLGDGVAKLIAEVSLVLPREVELSKAQVICRNEGLHVFCGDDWYFFSIDSLSGI